MIMSAGLVSVVLQTGWRRRRWTRQAPLTPKHTPFSPPLLHYRFRDFFCLRRRLFARRLCQRSGGPGGRCAGFEPLQNCPSPPSFLLLLNSAPSLTRVCLFARETMRMRRGEAKVGVKGEKGAKPSPETPLRRRRRVSRGRV